MRALLLSSGNIEGVSKNVSPEGTFGDVELWSLQEDFGDPHRNIFVIVNNVLISLATATQIEASPDRVPTSMSKLEDLLRENIPKSDLPMSLHPIIWEALGLPMDVREERLASRRKQKDERDRERFEHHERETATKKSREETTRKEVGTKILAGEAVSGVELFELAKHLGIKLQPSVAGMLKSNVESVDSKQMTLRRKTSSAAPFKLYREVAAHLAVK